jgi:hypothetical protein
MTLSRIATVTGWRMSYSHAMFLRLGSPKADSPHVVGVSASPEQVFSKAPQACIRLRADSGVANDAHAGRFVEHLYAKRKHPHQTNLRQVHLVSGVAPGDDIGIDPPGEPYRPLPSM